MNIVIVFIGHRDSVANLVNASLDFTFRLVPTLIRFSLSVYH